MSDTRQSAVLVRIPAQVREQLEKRAQRDMRSLSNECAKLIVDALNRRPMPHESCETSQQSNGVGHD